MRKERFSESAEGTARKIVPVNGREAALLILLQIWEERAYTAIALNRVLRQTKLEEQDRRFATELVNGSVKAKGTLDFILGQMVNRPLQKLEPVVRYILHLGLYQIFYLDRIPDSAACNESVNLAKKFSHKGTDKFVNGVLRNSVRQKILRMFHCDSVIPDGWYSAGGNSSVKMKPKPCAAGITNRPVCA